MTKLINLNVNHNPIADEGATKLTSLTNLRELYLNKTDITDTSIIALSTTNMQALEILKLNSNPISESILDNLGQLPALREITLGKTNIREDEVPKKLVVIDKFIFSRFHLVSPKNQQ